MPTGGSIDLAPVGLFLSLTERRPYGRYLRIHIFFVTIS
jgi:hypothetical protein